VRPMKEGPGNGALFHARAFAPTPGNGPKWCAMVSTRWVVAEDQQQRRRLGVVGRFIASILTTTYTHLQVFLAGRDERVPRVPATIAA
jgi:hypothetical protein